MFESLKTLWKKQDSPSEDYDEQSLLLAAEISRL